MSGHLESVGIHASVLFEPLDADCAQCQSYCIQKYAAHAAASDGLNAEALDSIHAAVFDIFHAAAPDGLNAEALDDMEVLVHGPIICESLPHSWAQ